MQTPSETADVKLDVLNEPSAHLIEENVALPEDTFRSYWSYLLYEMAHYKPIMVLLSVIATLGVLITLFHNNDACSIIFGISLFISSLVLLMALIAMSVRISDRDFIIKLLLEVITRKPAGKGWRTVAYNMNQYLFHEGLWYTPYYFYCGRKCQYFFNSLIETKKPNTESGSPTEDEENTQPDTQPDTSPNEALNEVLKYYFCSPDPVLEAYFVKAAEADQEAQHDTNWYKTDRYIDQHNIFQHHIIAIDKTRYQSFMQASSENADTKLDTLSEPSAHLIEENVALPEDIFSSYWSYLFHEVLHNIVIMIMFSVNVCLALLFLFFPHKKVHFFYVLSWVVSGFILLVSSIVFTKPINDQDFKINLLIEVIARKPAVKGKEWRTITYNMNQYLFDDDLWNTPYYFYRDKDCRRYFLRLLKGRTFKKQEESSTSNVTGIQSDEATTGTPMEATKSFTFSVGPNFTKLLTKAAEVEQQAQNNYWQERVVAAIARLNILNPIPIYSRKNIIILKDIFRLYPSKCLYEVAHLKMVMFSIPIIPQC
ncbi:CPA_1a_G0000820.mRNA.1.CDS.1 [Saccharomyces cerevisiae]|nr:CPA_1a_G0000820.mRNA.1.CDS.1 [Saccharomyces cerevisiae]CAI7129064.1 CPA_1a_G0000820.mRNA.1.CDS.1 [Saccharomyces cerevisiae]